MRYRGVGLAWMVLGTAAALACGRSSTEDDARGGTAGVGGDTADTGSGGSGGKAGKGGSDGAGKGGKGGASAGGTGGDDGGAGGVPGGPSLTVVVGDFPGGTSPEITIEGPDGFSETITATATFSDLEPGAYTVTTETEAARVDGELIDSIFESEITGSPAEVAENGETVQVEWARRPGTGMLWLGNQGVARVVGYTAQQLVQSDDDLAPAVVLELPPHGTASSTNEAIAFDEAGNLWVGYCAFANQVPQAVARFAPSELAASGTPEAEVVITTPDDPLFDCVSALVPDADGGLWVGFQDGGIVKYSAEQLEASGAPTPTISLSGAGLGTLTDLIFDPQGNLWVSAYFSNNVHKLTPDQLATSSASLMPAVTWSWTGSGEATHGPTGLALAPTPSEEVWVSFYQDGYLAAFDLDTAAGADPSEVVTLDSDEIFAGAPEQLAFDEAGNLWVALYDGNQFARIDADDLTTGDQVPSVIIGSPSLSLPYGLRLNPPIE